MTARSKDEEVRAVIAELDALAGQLRDNVAALSDLLAPPPAPDDEEVPVP